MDDGTTRGTFLLIHGAQMDFSLMFYLAEKLLLTVLATRIINICIHLYINLSMMHPSKTLINYILVWSSFRQPQTLFHFYIP